MRTQHADSGLLTAHWVFDTELLILPGWVYDAQQGTLGKTSQKKNVYLRALPKLAPLVLFFLTSKRRFARMTEQSDDDNIDDCNDNYDSNDWNFEDNDEKMTKKQVKIYQF